MKKSFLLLALLSAFMFTNAEEYCDMGFCFELGKFQAKTYRTADDEPYMIKANRGTFTAMAIIKNWQPELLSTEERVDFLKARLDKALADQTRNTAVFYSIKFTEEEENLGMIKAHCLTGFAKIGLGATQYKYYLFEKDNIIYCAEFSTPGGKKGFEKAFRTMIDSFYMPQ